MNNQILLRLQPSKRCLSQSICRNFRWTSCPWYLADISKASFRQRHLPPVRKRRKGLLRWICPVRNFHRTPCTCDFAVCVLPLGLAVFRSPRKLRTNGAQAIEMNCNLPLSWRSSSMGMMTRRQCANSCEWDRVFATNWDMTLGSFQATNKPPSE